MTSAQAQALRNSGAPQQHGFSLSEAQARTLAQNDEGAVLATVELR